MALNNITFNRTAGGLGRPLNGEDHISGLVAFVADLDLPAGFTTTARTIVCYSLADATAAGIVSTSSVDEIKVVQYNIAEFFRINPKGVLYVSFAAASADYSKIKDVQYFADGKIRQIAVITAAVAVSTTNVGTLQTHAETLRTENKPLVVLLGADSSAIALGSLVDLRATNKDLVSVVIGQDGAGTGAALATATTKSVPNVGAVLGALSKGRVNESIAWIAKYNFGESTEMDVPALGNGALVKNQTAALLTAINDKGYIFFLKHTGISGTYANDSHNCATATSDFAYIENNRTIDKAVRNIRAALLPNLASPLLINADGTLTETTIAVFQNDARGSLDQMFRDLEISAAEVTIDPVQDVLTTSTLTVGVSIVPVGVARAITVNIGFVVSLT